MIRETKCSKGILFLVQYNCHLYMDINDFMHVLCSSIAGDFRFYLCITVCSIKYY